MSRPMAAVAVSALSLIGTVVGAVFPTASEAALRAKSGCTHAVLSPYVQSTRESAASLVTALIKYGASSSQITTIAITQADGDVVRFKFVSGHFTISGSGVPAACRSITVPDDWTF
jgi:hypothetical protein